MTYEELLYADIDTKIENLGKRFIKSPLDIPKFTSDDEKILYNVNNDYVNDVIQGKRKPVYFELAGPRECIYFDPKQTRAAIVTCGGLCPGLNSVIRSIVMTLYYNYGCKDILGVRNGYRGFIEKYGLTPLRLEPRDVVDIHEKGGTILGSSRGPQDIKAIVDTLERWGVDILFTIGGDGTQKGALAISEEIQKRGLKKAVVGVPKTIDNDISLVAKSFGFETAFSTAVEAIRSAHNEAEGAVNGIGIVKLMGRESGFIAANASLALKDVNFVLIPEVDFDLDPPNGFLAHLKERILARHHAVIVVAEGAGQKFFKNNLGVDASGNKILGDIGLFLKDKIKEFFKKENIEVTVKYIDPSYIIRSVAANPNDNVFCGLLGQMAVHAAMAGKTEMIVGVWNNMFTHIPIKSAVQMRKKVLVDKKLWLSVLGATGQPKSMLNEK